MPSTPFRRVLVTGAAGSLGSALRPALAEQLDELRLTDVRPVADLQQRERFVAANLLDAAEVGVAVEGVEAVIHLGAIADEAPFDELLGPNLVGTFNVFEAARRAGVRRVIYASSNRITGFYPAERRLRGDEPVRPDGLYGVTKAFGEAMGRLYADKFGLEVVCVRIGSFLPEPTEARHLSTWLSPGDAVRLFRACLEAHDVGFTTTYGVSANTRSWWDLEGAAERLGYVPEDDAERYADRVPPDGTAPALQGGAYTAVDYGGWAS